MAIRWFELQEKKTIFFMTKTKFETTWWPLSGFVSLGQNHLMAASGFYSSH
jgi:hypothetical protein